MTDTAHGTRQFCLCTILLALIVLPMAPSGAAPVVAVVASDDTTLPQPAPRADSLSADQVEAMVRRAVDLTGGMGAVVADTARLVVIKPNISIPEPPETGIVTDPRLVRAVALLVNEVAPQAAIRIAEAPASWVLPETADSVGFEAPIPMRWFFDYEVDGFEVGGYRAIVEELAARGIDIDCTDMNWARNDTLRSPGGGLADAEYILGGAVVAADVWINCPVMKTHGPKITVAMKNRFGLLPGAVYGMSKNQGTESHPPMPHKPANVEESMVDIWLAEPEDLVVVDGIVGREEGALFDGEPLRTNQVLAGTNPVAVDLTAAYLMGFNPDDMEFAMLAARTGHGPRWFEEVEVRGADPDRLRRRFKKAGSAYGGILFGDEWEQIAGYGRTPRHWSLMGPLPADHEMTAAEIASLTPIPGEGGWSDPVWFGDDKIDLDERFDDPSNVVVYAFTWFRMARADSVRFWAGSDEGLQVWIDGETVYEHTERRQHVLGEDRSAGFLDAGEHRLLVRVHQRRGPFEFSFAICEPIDDPLFAGNTPAGLRYYPDRRRPDEF